MSEPRTATYFNLLPRERLEAEALRLEHAIARVRGLPWHECDREYGEPGDYEWSEGYNAGLQAARSALDSQEAT